MKTETNCEAGETAPWARLSRELREQGTRRATAGEVHVVACVTVHVDGPAVEVGRKQYPMGPFTAGRYAMRRGVRRHLDILARHGVPATFFACGHDVEQYPDLFREILREGHEIAAHGYVHEGWELGAEEPALLAKTHRILQDMLGVEAVGWCSPSGRKSALTLPALRQLGYRYDASEKDLDRPYMVAQDADGQGFVMLPNNTVSLDDYPMYFTGGALASEVYDNWVQEFDAIRQAEGYLQLTVHPKAGGGSGTPARAAVVDRYLAHLTSQTDVHFMTMQSLAEHCLAHSASWMPA
jgi:peptidoglycan/xylan/chitin deacetylase (PgdA/CDA1 family)